MTNSDSITQKNEEKQTVSARVNSHIVEMYKSSGIPLSLVIENSLVNFLKLSEEEKIRFLSENMPGEITTEKLKPLSKNWKELLADYLAKYKIPPSVAPKLLSGLCVGAISVIGAVLVTLYEESKKK